MNESLDAFQKVRLHQKKYMDKCSADVYSDEF
jgi:hypothetical protein